MQIQGRRGKSIELTIGVKQGCSLSPTLFGLLRDGVHFDLKNKVFIGRARLKRRRRLCGPSHPRSMLRRRPLLPRRQAYAAVPNSRFCV